MAGEPFPELRVSQLRRRTLAKLEEAGLVASKLELSADGKALNYFAAADFALTLTPAAIAIAAASLTPKSET